MTELILDKVSPSNPINNYLLIYSLKKRIANIAFEDKITKYFKKYCIYDNLEKTQSFYFTIPLCREKILCRIKNIISEITDYFEESDYIYMVYKFSDSIDSLDEKDVLIGHEIIKEHDMIWDDIVRLHKIGLLDFTVNQNQY